MKGLAWWTHLFVDRFMENSSISGVIIPDMLEFVTSLAWGLLLIVAIAVFPYCVYLGLRSFLVSSLNPNLSSPKSSLKCFLNSIRSDLYERAYNLLTDQAQKAGRVKLPRKGFCRRKCRKLLSRTSPPSNDSGPIWEHSPGSLKPGKFVRKFLIRIPPF